MERDIIKVEARHGKDADNLMAFIQASQARLATLARSWYAADGRGFIRVVFPSPPPPGVTTTLEVEGPSYHALDDLP